MNTECPRHGNPRLHNQALGVPRRYYWEAHFPQLVPNSRLRLEIARSPDVLDIVTPDEKGALHNLRIAWAS